MKEKKEIGSNLEIIHEKKAKIILKCFTICIKCKLVQKLRGHVTLKLGVKEPRPERSTWVAERFFLPSVHFFHLSFLSGPKARLVNGRQAVYHVTYIPGTNLSF